MHVDPSLNPQNPAFFGVARTIEKDAKSSDGATSFKLTDPGSPRAGQNQAAARTGNIDFQQRSITENSAVSCLLSLLNPETGFRDFNSHADALKQSGTQKTTLQGEPITVKSWKAEIAQKVDLMSTKNKEKIASISLYDLVDYDREAVRHILECLSKSKDLNEETKNNLNSKVENLKTLIIEVDEHGPDYKFLGGGALNKVYRARFTDENGERSTGVFKPDPSELDVWTQIKEGGWGTAQGSKIPAGDDAHSTARSVGSYALDKLLFKNKPIGVKTEYVILNDKRGILMENAKGASLAPRDPKSEKERVITPQELKDRGILDLIRKDGKIVSNWIEIIEATTNGSNIRLDPNTKQMMGIFPEFHIEKPTEVKVESNTREYRKITETIKYLTKLHKELTKEDKTAINEQFKIHGFRLEDDSLFVGKTPTTRVNLENPVTAQGMLKLQVFDWITGQVDRHPGNYFIDPETGEVQAIDNDCSFGVGAVPEGVDVREQPTLGGIVPNMGSLMLRMPTVLTESVRNDILELHADPEKLQETMDQYISDAELKATRDRLDKLVFHITKGPCKVVADPKDLYNAENLLLQDSNNSLYLRERDRYFTKVWNDLRRNDDVI